MRRRDAMFFCVIASVMGGCNYDPIKGDGENRRLLATAQIDAIGEAMHECATDIGRFPNQVEGLSLLAANSPGLSRWRGPYLRTVPADPWGKPYQYSVSSDGSVARVTCCDGSTSGGGPRGAAPVSRTFSYAPDK